MKFTLYDIESLQNIFCQAFYTPKDNLVELFVLADEQFDEKGKSHDPTYNMLAAHANEIAKRIYERNYNFNGTIRLYDLHLKSHTDEMGKRLGISDAYLVNYPDSKSTFPKELRPVCDTDPEYDEDKHPYLAGYNSYNYDTTMNAMYFHEVYSSGNFEMTTAEQMRSYNNELFLPEFKDRMASRLTVTQTANHRWSAPNYRDPRYLIRNNMLKSGRHIDIAKLNEKQEKVGLKRLLGMLGYQILESDKLATGTDRIENLDQFYELLAYNVSDVVNLNCLANHKVYTRAFALKKALLNEYPELIYMKQDNAYKPDIRPEKVRRDRLCIDSSSAQFATMTLCPYGHLKDIPVVSFDYPSQKQADKLGIPRVNVLEESKKFFYANFTQPELRARFDVIYNYYKNIEGRNFNNSENYQEDYGENATPAEKLSEIPDTDTHLPYFDKDGNETTCFVTFSTGGIHGAEINMRRYLAEKADWDKKKADLDYVKSLYPNALDCKWATKYNDRSCKFVKAPDGHEISLLKCLASGATFKQASYKSLDKTKPLLFKTDEKGKTKINPKYVYTSADETNHEDFTSYYPNLLRMLEAFYNEGLGYDRYGEIFNKKSEYGKLMKDTSLPKEKREEYATSRSGVKLILNSASGAGDTAYNSAIVMNNQIISMRIIGQLFSWRIGQAQAIQGAKITSTNTDGLYSVLEPTLNNKILEKESESIHVDIEPEPLYLISKDSNNRIECNIETEEIYSASGGSLACQNGPDPTKSLAHPAVIDWALCRYLIKAAKQNDNTLSLSTEFNEDVGREILMSTYKLWDKTKWLNMFQNIIASSTGSVMYIFGLKDNNPDPIILQHYNRTFIMKDDTANTMHLQKAMARVITAATAKKRKKANEPPVQHDPLARQILRVHGVNNIEVGKEAAISKITLIEPTWSMLIQNKALENLTLDEIEFVRDNIDIEKYLGLLKDSFTKNWRNILPDKTNDLIDVEVVITDKNTIPPKKTVTPILVSGDKEKILNIIEK